MHGAIGGAYRSQRITTLELRFNPMKRNRGGERDLDHIILAAIRGRRPREPRVPAGARRADPDDGPHVRPRQNEIIVEKAIRWAARGVVGIDIAGPRPGGGRYDYAQIAPIVETARDAGLGVTIHVGEEGGDMGREEIGEVVEHLRPDRIGHGILAAQDAELMAAHPRRRDHARDLPDVEPPHEGAARTRTPCATRSARSSSTTCRSRSRRTARR